MFRLSVYDFKSYTDTIYVRIILSLNARRGCAAAITILMF